MTYDACKNFCCCEKNIDDQAEQSEPGTGLPDGVTALVAGHGGLHILVRRVSLAVASMNKTISAAVYEKHGNPADVLRVETRPWPTPAADEAVVKMCAAPINPADLNQIEGKYPVRPALPATPGFEGAGIVVELGAGVNGLTIGALVILPHNVGTWRDAVAVKARRARRCA